MMKRPAGSFAAASQAKKMAKVKLSPVEKKVREVAEALKKELKNLPTDVTTMLGDVAPLSLALCIEERHAYQQGVVDMLEKELTRHEENLEAHITEVDESIEQVGKDREAQEGVVAELETALKAKQAQAHEKKYALADCALDFRHKREGLAEAQAKQRALDGELELVALKHEGLSKAIVETLQPLKEGTMEKERVPKAAVELVPTLQRYFHVEESLVPAIPTVFSKEPSARGAFDTMAATQLEEQAQKALQGFAATSKSGEASKAERAAAVEAAEEAFAAARNAQRAGAAAFTAADEEGKAAEAALDAAKTTLRAFGPEKTRRVRASGAAHRALMTFRTGPLAAFKELSTRSNKAVEEPADMEAAAGEEVSADSAEEEATEEDTVPAEAADAEMPAVEEVAA